MTDILPLLGAAVGGFILGTWTPAIWRRIKETMKTTNAIIWWIYSLEDHVWPVESNLKSAMAAADKPRAKKKSPAKKPIRKPAAKPRAKGRAK